ncbi:MAG: Lrp/AsnC ligand binding domain-containing protein [Chloroflexi bacterium]|nr:Lrp/AsnC ligand binding domain-containing protein [Chloroflexota bacterium]
MTSKAYVLIDTEIGKVERVAEALCCKPGMIADIVTGPHDIIAVVQAADPDGVAKTVMTDIHGVPGIVRTITCLVVQSKT